MNEAMRGLRSQPLTVTMAQEKEKKKAVGGQPPEASPPEQVSEKPECQCDEMIELNERGRSESLSSRTDSNCHAGEGANG